MVAGSCSQGRMLLQVNARNAARVLDVLLKGDVHSFTFKGCASDAVRTCPLMRLLTSTAMPSAFMVAYSSYATRSYVQPLSTHAHVLAAESVPFEPSCCGPQFSRPSLYCILSILTKQPTPSWAQRGFLVSYALSCGLLEIRARRLRVQSRAHGDEI